MTERDYIDTTDLVKVRTMIKILTDITPSVSSCIGKADWGVMYETLLEWEEKLSERIYIEQ